MTDFFSDHMPGNVVLRVVRGMCHLRRLPPSLRIHANFCHSISFFRATSVLAARPLWKWLPLDITTQTTYSVGLRSSCRGFLMAMSQRLTPMLSLRPLHGVTPFPCNPALARLLALWQDLGFGATGPSDAFASSGAQRSYPIGHQELDVGRTVWRRTARSKAERLEVGHVASQNGLASTRQRRSCASQKSTGSHE